MSKRLKKTEREMLESAYSMSIEDLNKRLNIEYCNLGRGIIKLEDAEDGGAVSAYITAIKEFVRYSKINIRLYKHIIYCKERGLNYDFTPLNKVGNCKTIRLDSSK